MGGSVLRLMSGKYVLETILAWKVNLRPLSWGNRYINFIPNMLRLQNTWNTVHNFPDYNANYVSIYQGPAGLRLEGFLGMQIISEKENQS